MEQSRTQNVYDGSILYSHAADDLLAPGLQKFCEAVVEAAGGADLP